MRVGDVVSWLDAIAPLESAETFDNVGLLIGDSGAEIHTVLFGMDVTEAMVHEAVGRNAELIVTHHPFIFHPLKRIDYTGPQGRILCSLLQRRMNVIAAHTNWDKATGGVSDSLADALGLLDIESCDAYLRLGTLPKAMTADELASHISRTLGFPPRCYPAGDSPISRVAVAGGAYGEGYLAAAAMGAQAFVVGEVKHHELADASARGLTIYDAGHFSTELPGTAALYERFLLDAHKAGWAVKAYLHSQAPYSGVFPTF